MTTIDSLALASVTGGFSLDRSRLHSAGKQGALIGTGVGAVAGAAIAPAIPAVIIGSFNPALFGPAYMEAAPTLAPAGAAVGAPIGAGLGYAAGAAGSAIAQTWNQLTR